MNKNPEKNNSPHDGQNFFQSDHSPLENLVEPFAADVYDDEEEVDDGQDTMDQEDEETDSQKAKQDEEVEQKEEDKKSDDSSTEHEGKYLVIQKGMACCDKGAKFPNFKVTSHQKHYYNDEKGEADYLAVTEDDLTFNPAATPFGTCSVKNGNPCAYAPSGKWTKTYEKVKVMGKSALTEISELMCATGGKITVMKHGQQSEAGKSNVNNADLREQQAYNPIVDFGAFQNEVNQSDQLYYE